MFSKRERDDEKKERCKRSIDRLMLKTIRRCVWKAKSLALVPLLALAEVIHVVELLMPSRNITRLTLMLTRLLFSRRSAVVSLGSDQITHTCRRTLL